MVAVIAMYLTLVSLFSFQPSGSVRDAGMRVTVTKAHQYLSISRAARPPKGHTTHHQPMTVRGRKPAKSAAIVVPTRLVAARPWCLLLRRFTSLGWTKTLRISALVCARVARFFCLR